MRVGIARLLIDEPDSLMLDEPQPLDLESLLWFQNYLQAYRGASSDFSRREFINDICEPGSWRCATEAECVYGLFPKTISPAQERRGKPGFRYHRSRRKSRNWKILSNKFRPKRRRLPAQAKNQVSRENGRIELRKRLRRSGFPSATLAERPECASCSRTSAILRWKTLGVRRTGPDLERGQKIGSSVRTAPGNPPDQLLAGAILSRRGTQTRAQYGRRLFFAAPAEMFKEGRPFFKKPWIPAQPQRTDGPDVLGSFSSGRRGVQKSRRF